MSKHHFWSVALSEKLWLGNNKHKSGRVLRLSSDPCLT